MSTSARHCAGAPTYAASFYLIGIFPTTLSIIRDSSHWCGATDRFSPRRHAGRYSFYKFLHRRPDVLEVFTASDNLLMRMFSKHPALEDIFASLLMKGEGDAELIDSLKMLIADDGRRGWLEKLVKDPNKRLQTNHWRRLLKAPAFLDYIGRDPIFAAALAGTRGLLLDIVSRPLPKSFDMFDLPASPDETRKNNKAAVKDRVAHLRAVIPRLGEPVLLDDGIKVGPGEVTLVEYFQTKDDNHAGRLLEEMVPAADYRAPLQDARQTLLKHKEMAALVREHAGLSRALLNDPAQIDFLVKSPEFVRCFMARMRVWSSRL